ncbi:MAG: SprT family zinc-dependent metalloprotease [Pseudomonadota bacterium]
MGQHTLQGNPPITVHLRTSARAKRLSLRLSRLDGKVTLTIPQFASQNLAIAFLEERETWLRRHIADVKPAEVVCIGGTVPVAGKDVPVTLAPGRRAAVTEEGIIVPDAATAGAKVKALLRAKARDKLATVSDDYAAALGRPYSRLTLRDTRSRWGSCTTDGALMYSWRLIMAPPDVLHYVAAHEVAHLEEMNHSPAFWAVVERLFGDYTGPRRWLRTEGDRLHRIQFDN